MKPFYFTMHALEKLSLHSCRLGFASKNQGRVPRILAKSSQALPSREVGRMLQLIALFFLVGCATPNKPYWIVEKDGVVEPLKPASKDPKFSNRLAIVEFDEQGDVWSQKQIQAAQTMVKESPKPPLLLVFIHGWQNNAHPKNLDLETFNKLLLELNSTKSIYRKFTVNGVYMGWRGATFFKESDWTGLGWFLRQTSFWSRRSATDRVAGVPLTGALAKLSAAARGAKSGRGVTVFIGHSFGGRIMERALGQALVSQAAFSKSDELELLADLTILINPASESLYARNLRVTTKSQKRPAIVSITAENDVATSFLWPAGLELASAFGGFRNYSYRSIPQESQRGYITKTTGHDGRMLTHAIERASAGSLPQTDEPFGFNLARAKEGAFLIRDRNGIPIPYRIRRLDKSKDGKGVTWMLPDGPYWVMRVPPEVLDGHSGQLGTRGIFSDQVIDLLGAVFSLAKAGDINATPTVTLQNDPNAGEPSGLPSQ